MKTTCSLFAMLLGTMLLPAACSAAEEEAAPKEFDQVRDVSRGSVIPETYESKALGFQRKLMLYTPPGYDKDKKYPVLYLLHGVGDDETGWIQKGSANVVLDNLYADKKIVPMLVVMPFGFTTKPGEPTRNPNATPEERRKSAADFENDLLKDLIPFIEGKYSGLTDQAHRALAGLSMGGGQTMRIGPPHADTFAYLGVFSQGVRATATGTQPDPTQGYPDADTLNTKLKLFWVSCGEKDNLFEPAKRYSDLLTEKKIKHIWHPEAGAHDWPVWKNDLYLFTQRLFQ